MLHPTASRQPAIPAVGFLQGALVPPHVPDLAHAVCGRDRAPACEARDPYVAYVQANSGHSLRVPKWLDYVAAAFVVVAVAFGPAVTWLLAR